MAVTYFVPRGSPEGCFGKFNKASNQGEGVIKNALILFAGKHQDNSGTWHEISEERLRKIARNSNAAFNKGIEIPLKVEHKKELIGDQGELNKLGSFIEAFETRPIRETDLPNSRASHLVGKLGLFSKAQILNKVEEVKSGLIKLLSPGIDLVRERIAEVSVVLDPAIDGPCLFSKFNSTSYADAKQKAKEGLSIQEDLEKSFRIFIDVLIAIENQENGFVESLKASALKEYTEDLKEILDLDQAFLEPIQDAYAPDLEQKKLYRRGEKWTTNYGV